MRSTSKLGPGAVRYLLALAVVFFHGSLYAPVGRAAVYVFFALSGYWMSRMYERVYARASLRTYAVSRAARLLPTYFATLALTIAVMCAYAWLGDRPLEPSVARLAEPKALFFNLVILGLHDRVPLAVLPPAWSLDIELQFYALLPAIVWLRKRFGDIALLAAFALCIGANVIGDRTSHAVYVFRYLGFFAIGMALHRRGTGPVLPRAVRYVANALALLLFAAPYFAPGYGQAVMFDKSASFHGHYVWVLHNLGLAHLLIPFVDHNVRTASSPFDRTLGEMSYGLYLGHWCPLLLFRERWQAFDAGDSALELLLFVACSCAVGWLLHSVADARCEPRRRAWLERTLTRESANEHVRQPEREGRAAEHQ